MSKTLTAGFNNYIITSWVEEALTLASEFKADDDVYGFSGDQDFHRSAFQKCVRRGWTTLAVFHGNMLRGLDEKSAWLTLSVIAGEDVGIGAPYMVGLSLICVLKTFRDVIGNDHALFNGIVIGLCRAYKNRTGCHIDVLALNIAPIPGLDVASDDSLLGMLGQQSLITQYRAMAELRKRCRHGNVLLLNQIVEAIKTMFPNPMIGLAASLCFERVTDSLHYGTCLTMAHVYSGEAPPLKKMDIAGIGEPVLMPNSTVPMIALDQHTSIGRMALGRWAKTDKMQALAKEYGIAPNKMNMALGAITFFKEAAVVCPRLDIQDFQVNDIANMQELTYTGNRAETYLDQEGYDALAAKAVADIAEFNDIRLYLWKKHQQGE